MTKFLFEELAFSDNYRRSPTRRILLAIIVFSGIIAIGYLFDLRSLQLNFFSQHQQYMSLQQQYSKVQQQTSDLNSARAELNTLQATFNSLHQDMPTSANSQI